MRQGKCITVVGGGLAGLTLGIGLRQLGVPVVVFEAGYYPRHRVCGEFISGQGIAILEALDLLKLCRQAGSQPARTVRFVFHGKPSRVQVLPAAAESISRFELDCLLATEFKRLGGELREGERWREDFLGVVRASGRKAHAPKPGCTWIGLKGHARNVELQADLEMHAVPGGYTGLSRLGDGSVNVCGLFRQAICGSSQPAYRHRNSGGVENILTRLRGPAGSDINSKLAKATFDRESICAVSALSLRPERAINHEELVIGDALTMIPPITGNGMSMAFESAACAIVPMRDYSQGRLSWSEARCEVARACDAAFKRRLRWARWLQWFMLTPAVTLVFGPSLGNSPALLRALFDRTR